MVKRIAICICVAVLAALSCKPQPASLNEATRVSGAAAPQTFSVQPGQCTQMTTYKVCRVLDGDAEYLTVLQGDTGLVRIRLPAAGGVPVPFDGCECKYLGCQPMCSASGLPSGPMPPPDAGVTRDGP